MDPISPKPFVVDSGLAVDATPAPNAGQQLAFNADAGRESVDKVIKLKPPPTRAQRIFNGVMTVGGIGLTIAGVIVSSKPLFIVGAVAGAVGVLSWAFGGKSAEQSTSIVSWVTRSRLGKSLRLNKLRTLAYEARDWVANTGFGQDLASFGDWVENSRLGKSFIGDVVSLLWKTFFLINSRNPKHIAALFDDGEDDVRANAFTQQHLDRS